MENVKSQMEMLLENSQGVVNYSSWRFKLNLILRTRKLCDVATGVTAKPATTDSGYSSWVEKDLESQALIGLNVSSKISNKIANCKSASKMLEKLESLYGKKSDLSLEGLRRRFFGYSYNASMSAVNNCLEVVQIAENLESEGEEIKKEWVMTRILGILPPKLHHLRAAWDNISEENKKVDVLIERIRLEEDRLNQSELVKGNASQNAMVSVQEPKPNRQGKQSLECFKCGKKGHIKKFCKSKPCAKYIQYCKENYPCNICKQKGHYAKECPNINSNERSEGTVSNRRAMITIGLSAINLNSIRMDDDNSAWYQDCGATQHMTFRKEWMSNFTRFEEPVTIVIGDATELLAIGKGDVELEAFNGRVWYEVILKDVLFVPKMTFNLFSVTQLLDKGYIQVANANMSTFKTSDGKETVGIAKREGRLFRMMLRVQNPNACLMTVSIKTWHERLAHQCIKYVRDILNRSQIDYIDDWDDHVCVGCVYGKQHRISHPRNLKVANSILDLVHVDLCEMNLLSLGGAKYFLLFKDDFSHFRTVYFLKAKNEVFFKLKTFLKMVENQFGRTIKCLKSDNGTEIKNANVEQLLRELGIRHEKSVAYSPQQNGRIEREMRTVVESARSAIHARSLNENLWAEAVNYAVFTLNQTGTSSVKGRPPADLWFGRRMSVEKLHSFGCECYVLTPDHKRTKTGRKSRRGIFVGYNVDSSSYRIYLPENGDTVNSDNVIFNEKQEIDPSMGIQINTVSSQNRDPEEEFEVTNDSSSNSETIRELTETVIDEQETFEQRPLPNLRDRNRLRKPARYTDYETEFTSEEDDPEYAMIGGEIKNIDIKEALRDAKWQQALQEEYDSLINMETWTLVEAPKDARVMSCRWVLREKQDGRLKARLVVRGFEQIEGVDYDTTFSPVARHASIRLLLSLAASKGMKMKTFDVKTAFLHGKLEDEIFMHQPEGFNDGSKRVCRLHKSLYGLKQAPKNWNERFSKFLKTLGYRNTDDDPCIYYNEDRSIIIALFVDDGFVVGLRLASVMQVLIEINNEFEITFNRYFHDEINYLGMKIEQKSDGIFVSQPKYTEEILERFGFANCSPASTPMERGMLTDDANYVNDKPLPKNEPYRVALGSLMYLASISRPDISFAVNYLSRFCQKPMVSHWKMVKRIFQYLKGTSKCGIFFDGGESLVAYTDSDYGGDTTTGQSTTGVLIMRGGPLVWYAQKQRLVATSTAEAEYRAAVSSIDEICWIRRLGHELQMLNVSKPTLLYVDNQSAIHMLKNTCEGKITKGKKHIDIPRKFIQEHVNTTVQLEHVRSSDQLADILTKPLVRKTFEDLRGKIIKEEC